MAFHSALSGLKGSASELKVIGNNIANAGTTGFKRSSAEFSDVYLASALGTKSNAIGAGTKLNAVVQEFNQGAITDASSNLDMAINGGGFFRLDDGGNTLYTRAGSFRLDKDGYVTNSDLQKLTGYQADSSGNITSALGTLRIDNSNIAPKKTADIFARVNLDSSATPPTVDFASGFTPTSPPPATSYNNSTTTTVYDSLGNAHNLTAYFVKGKNERTWHVHLGMDGTDITPSSASVPAGTPPVSFPSGSIAKPFTLVFDSSGSLVPNNSLSPPKYYGAGPVSSTAADATNSGNLAAVNIGDLTLNGIPIDPPISTMDTVSTTDALSSGRAIAAAINAKTPLHGVTATANATTFDLGVVSNLDAAANLTEGELTINGFQILAGAGDLENIGELVTAINTQQSNTGVVASSPGGTDILLTAADGRNIQVVTNGATGAGGITAANLSMNGGAALDRVKRSNFSLATSSNLGLTVGGTAPGDVGLTAGALSGIIQSSSDVISIANWDPATGAETPQPVGFDLSGTTSFSAPFSISNLSQDGYGVGRLTNVEVDQTGVITARYGNGQSKNLGQVVIATFNSPDGLELKGDTIWKETSKSGTALVGVPGTSNAGLITSGSLEESNVNLTDELVSLIVAQRNFQANAQTIKTDDAVTQTAIQIRG